MTFQTIHTTYGLTAMDQAEATGVPINLTHMAVGDGGGNPVTPDEGMTALVNERWRTTVNTVVQDPSNPKVFYVEMIIPAATGGWTVREVGVFDEDGNMFVVSNYPETYKTVPSDGATNDLCIRLEFMASNASVITLVVDPAVTVATRSWVINNITAAELIPGGTTGQVLTKQSNADGDADWQDPDSNTVLVNTLEEQQTLAASQLTINMAERTTFGLSVLIEGVRLPRRSGAGGWQQGASDTQIVLGGPTGGGYYPVGTEVTMLQNEPAGNLPTPLEKSLNLSDVPDKPTARTNLDVYSRAETDQKGPTGMVAYFARNTPPSGWLAANGAVVSRTTYAVLFSAIGTTFNTGGEAGTDFRLPDGRGEFIRGWDNSRGVDVGRVFGSWQADQLKAHTHSYEWFPGEGNGETDNNYQAGHTQVTGTTGSTGGAETRPRNLAMLCCIKF